MPIFFKPKQYSLSTKVILALIFFIFFFLFIRFSLVIPKIQKKSYDNEIENISRSLFYVKEQMKMAVKAIRMQSRQEADLIKEKIVSQIKDLKLEANNLTNKELLNKIDKGYFSNFCSYKIKSKDFEYKKIKGKNLFNKNNTSLLDSWQVFEKRTTNKIVQRKRIYLLYNTKLDSKRLLTIGCHIRVLNPSHEKFEEELRSHIQKNLSLIESTINSKTIIFWINPKLTNEQNRPLFEKNKNLRQKRYRLSKLSNTRTLTTGNLSVKQILEARNKKPLEYKLNGVDVVTWVINLSIKDSKNLYTLIYTVNKNDIIKKSNTNILVLLPETLIAIAISFILLLFIFKKLFKKIDTVTQSAIKVNKGCKNIRSKVKGKDDIGQLGIAFDSMLDFFENNIKILDSKVEEKTSELKTSLNEKSVLLEEKETLLKEIHHRVKNNLAKTITLIELQENDIEDIKTKKSLVDIKERIYTMELLHRKLYESTNLNEIPLKEYLIDLIKSISRAYNIDDKIQMKLLIDNINLNIDTAMPCGLIINELYTNAIKYAFANNEKPKLEIKVSKDKNQLNIVFKDNGKGLESKLLEEKSTLGLKLINTLVRFQLAGTLEYKYDNGATFVINGTIKETNN